ncbi:DNA mismatch repair protein pms1-like protein [Elsinoe fawcettii]|nr:DNA mismatch repair protein pms1-like protein [Elsinoe fawcettii]
MGETTGIVALPQETVRALGSTQSLVDSVAVVKELIENALDANATSIVIEVSANALDVIQVKDNGHGVSPADRHLVAKRHCTSKIVDEQDLRRLQGRTLGFRGEALSHVADMSNELTMTTRVDGEVAGSHLIFSRNGTLKDEQSTKVVGRAVTAQSQLLEHGDRGTSIEALLPKPDIDTSKLKGRSEHVVILDGRPLRHDLGLAKRLLKKIKHHAGMRNMNERFGNLFMCLRVSCREAKYDCTIEPSKDDALFDNADAVVKVLVDLLDAAYPPSAADPKATPIIHSNNEGSDTDARETANDMTKFMATMTEHLGSTPATAESMAESSVDDLCISHSEGCKPPLDKSAYNPWTMAKINSPRKLRQEAHEDVMAPVTRSVVVMPRAGHDKQAMPALDALAWHVTGLLTPERSSPLRKVPSIGSQDRSLGNRSLPPAQLYFPTSPFASSSEPIPVPLQTLEGRARAEKLPETPPIAPDSAMASGFMDDLVHPNAARVSVKVKRPHQQRAAGQEFRNKPFKVPAADKKDPERDAWFDFSALQQRAPAQKRPRLDSELMQQNIGGDLENSKDIRTFLRSRKAPTPEPGDQSGDTMTATTMEGRIDRPLSGDVPMVPELNAFVDNKYIIDQEDLPSPSASRLHRPTSSNRRALTEMDNSAADPRDLLLRPRTKSGRMKRAKSSMLPLERTATEKRLQNLEYSVRLSSATLETSFISRLGEAGYFEMDEDPLAAYCGLEDIKNKEMGKMVDNLQALLVKFGSSVVVDDFEAILRNALAEG